MKTGGRTAIAVLQKASHEDRTLDSSAVKTEHKMCDFEAWDISTTIIREPTSRLLSHYRMILQHELFGWRRPPHRNAFFGSDDPVWLDKSLELFLKKFPAQWKTHQLYFYSKSGDVDEAFDNIVQNTQIILFERRREGFDRLAKKLEIDPELFQDQKPPEWQTTKNIPLEVDDNQLSKIKDVLEKEYKFYNRVIDYYNEEQL